MAEYIECPDCEGAGDLDTGDGGRVWCERCNGQGKIAKATASHIVRDKKGNVKLSLEPEDTRSYQHGIGELLYGVDDLIGESSRQARGWWNSLSISNKRDHLRQLKVAGDGGFTKKNPQGDFLTKSRKQLHYQDFSSGLKDLIDTYYDVLMEEEEFRKNPRVENVGEVLQSASGSLSPQKRNKAIRALQNIPRGQALGQSDVFPAIDLAIESLLNGMDDLIASESERSRTKGWWNGMSKSDKIDIINVGKGIGSVKGSDDLFGSRKGVSDLRWDGLNRALQEDLILYWGELQDLTPTRDRAGHKGIYFDKKSNQSGTMNYPKQYGSRTA